MLKWLASFFGDANQQADQAPPDEEDSAIAENIMQIAQPDYEEDWEIGEEIGTVPASNPGQEGPDTDKHPSLWKRLFG